MREYDIIFRRIDIFKTHIHTLMRAKPAMNIKTSSVKMRGSNIRSLFWHAAILGIGLSLLGRVTQAQSSDANEEDAGAYAKALGASDVETASEIPDAGSSGLVLGGPVQGKVNPQASVGVTYSELRVRWKDGTIMSVIRTYGTNKPAVTLQNKSSLDPGYVGEAFWMLGGSQLVVRCGRFSEHDSYFLYHLNLKTKQISQVTTSSLRNSRVYPSPDGRYLAYIVNGGQDGLDSISGDSRPLELWIWDAKTNRKYKVGSNQWLEGSIAWRDATQLIYSVVERQGNIDQPFSLMWDVLQKKSTRFLDGGFAPRFSPDGQKVLYCASANSSRNYSISNSVYRLKNLRTNKISDLRVQDLGAFSPNRQILWSPDSSRVFSTLNTSFAGPHRIFMYDVVKEEGRYWSAGVTNARLSIIGSSSQGKRVFFLSNQPLEGKLNALGEGARRFSVMSLNTETGSLPTLFKRERILGIGEHSVVLSSQLKTD